MTTHAEFLPKGFFFGKYDMVLFPEGLIPFTWLRIQTNFFQMLCNKQISMYMISFTLNL